MPRVKITETFLQRDIKFPKKGQIDYWDTATSGFGARASYKRTISFVVKKNPPFGKPIRYTIKPPYDKDAFPLGDGRQEALKAFAQIKAGIHPLNVERKEREENVKRRSDTYGGAVEEFLELYHRGKKQNSEGHTKECKRVLLWPQGGGPKNRETLVDDDDHLWKSRPVSEIKDTEINRLLQRIVAAGKPYLANRVDAAMRTFFRWCTTLDGGKRIPASPMTGLTRPFEAERTRERVFNENELKQIWAAADELGRYPGALLKMMLLTGKRRGAVAAMRWDEFDDDWKWTPGPDKQTKTKKAFPAHLPPLAVQILKGLTKVADNPFVFVGRGNGEHLKPGTWLKKLIAEKSGVDDFYFHAIRHTLETKLAEGWEVEGGRYRVSPHIRDWVLDHAPARGTGAQYDHYEYTDEVREVMEMWAARIEELIMPTGVRALR